MRVRSADIHDLDGIRELHLSAFGEDERELVSQLAIDLFSEKTTPPTISLVVESDRQVVGQIAFSPVFSEDDSVFLGHILAPLGVRPEFQRRGIGSLLVRSGLEQVAALGASVLLVYGDPAYYGRFGCAASVAEPYIPVHELEYS